MSSGTACGAILLIAGLAFEAALVWSYFSQRRVGATVRRSPFVALVLLLPGAFLLAMTWSSAAQQWLLAGVCVADAVLWSVVGLAAKRHPPEYPEIRRRIARQAAGREQPRHPHPSGDE